MPGAAQECRAGQIQQGVDAVGEARHGYGYRHVVADEVLVGHRDLSKVFRRGVLHLVDGDEHSGAAQVRDELAQLGGQPGDRVVGFHVGAY